MIAILPIQPDILEMMAGDIGLEAEGPVWGYFAAEGTKMLGYIVVEKAEPVRIIALQCEDFVIADGLLRRPLTCERDVLPRGDKRLLHRESGEKRKKLLRIPPLSFKRRPRPRADRRRQGILVLLLG